MEYRCLVSFSVFSLYARVVQTLMLVCQSVPVSKLPELVYETKKDIASTDIISTIVGHVGDGKYFLGPTDPLLLKWIGQTRKFPCSPPV